jgi:hypothetical protein
MTDFYLVTGIFFRAYIVIVTERVHKTVVALVGAALMLALGIVDQHEAFHSEALGIDCNVIFLLIGTMIIINIFIGLFIIGSRKTSAAKFPACGAIRRRFSYSFPRSKAPFPALCCQGRETSVFRRIDRRRSPACLAIALRLLRKRLLGGDVSPLALP